MSFLKDPNAELDYQFDWSPWLATGETITSHVVTVTNGLTVSSSSATDTVVTVWLAGGATNTDYKVACLISTSAGRTDERTFTVSVRER